MKINVSAGKQTWDDFFCVDAVQHPKATRPLDAIFAFTFEPDGELVEQMPLDDMCADEVHSYHFIEHVHEWEAPALVHEFHRLLRPGGKLILELPDVAKACENLLKGLGDQMSMWPLYGDGSHKDPYMCHKYGYTPKSITALLKPYFEDIKILNPETHGRRANRDMRVECRST